MQFHIIVISVLASFISQGNIVSALPQEQFQARGEQINGGAKLAVLDAREAAPVAEVEVRSNFEQSNELVVRDADAVAKWIQTWTTIGAAVCGVTFVIFKACTTQVEREAIYNKLADCWAAIQVKAGHKSYKTAAQHQADVHAIQQQLSNH